MPRVALEDMRDAESRLLKRYGFEKLTIIGEYMLDVGRAYIIVRDQTRDRFVPCWKFELHICLRDPFRQSESSSLTFRRAEISENLLAELVRYVKCLADMDFPQAPETMFQNTYLPLGPRDA